MLQIFSKRLFIAFDKNSVSSFSSSVVIIVSVRLSLASLFRDLVVLFWAKIKEPNFQLPSLGRSNIRISRVFLWKYKTWQRFKLFPFCSLPCYPVVLLKARTANTDTTNTNHIDIWLTRYIYTHNG